MTRKLLIIPDNGLESLSAGGQIVLTINETGDAVLLLTAGPEDDADYVGMSAGPGGVQIERGGKFGTQFYD